MPRFVDRLLEDLGRWREIVFLEPTRGWLGLFLLLALLATLVLARGRRNGRVRSLIVRGVGLLLLVGVLMDPVVPYDVERVGRLVVIADVSPSMGLEGRSRAAGKVREAKDPYDLVLFGASARIAEPAPEGPFPEDTRQSTDIGAALGLAMARAAGASSVRAVLLSDGRATEPGAEQAAVQLRRLGVDLHAIALPEKTTDAAPPVAVKGLVLPSRDQRREPFTVEARVESKGSARVDAVLYVDGRSIGRQTVALPAGASTILFERVTLPEGTYQIQVALEGDGTPLNNVASKEMIVPGIPRVLFLAARARKALIAEALTAQGFQVEVQSVAAVTDFAPYDAVVLLPDAPAETLELRSGELAAFLGQRGGGLLAVGGMEGPGLARLAGTPIEFLLPLEVEPRAQEQEPEPPPPEPGEEPRIEVVEEEQEAYPISLCLLVDRSGSMTGDKLKRAQEAAVAAASALTPQDRIAVLAFSDGVNLILEPTPAGDPIPVQRAIASLRAGGNTAMWKALRAGYNLLDQEKTPIRHLVLLSDGVSTDSGRWRDLITTMTGRKITLSTVGIGFDVDMVKLARFAQWGKGRSWSANHPHEIPQVVTLDTKRVVAIRKKRGEDAERAREKEKEEEQKEEQEEEKEREKEKEKEREPEPRPPVPEWEIELDPAAPREAFLGLKADSLPSVSGVEEGRPRFAAWVAARAGDPGVPLLAYRRVGLGTTAALTVDPEAESGRGLREYDEFPRLMGQLMRSILPDVRREAFVLEHDVEGDDGEDRFLLRVLSEDGVRRTDLPVSVSVPGGPSFAVHRRGDGYEVSLPEGAPAGPLTVRIGPSGAPWLERTLFVPRSLEREREGGGADRAALLRLVGDSEHLDGHPERVFVRPVETIERRRSISLLFVLLAAMLLPIDAWVRRTAASGSR